MCGSCSSLGGGRVRRLVVDDDHLERPVVLRRERGDRGPHAPPLVASGHDHGHERAAVRGLHVIQRQPLSPVETRHDDAPRPRHDREPSEDTAHHPSAALVRKAASFTRHTGQEPHGDTCASPGLGLPPQAEKRSFNRPLGGRRVIRVHESDPPGGFDVTVVDHDQGAEITPRDQDEQIGVRQPA